MTFRSSFLTKRISNQNYSIVKDGNAEVTKQKGALSLRILWSFEKKSRILKFWIMDEGPSIIRIFIWRRLVYLK